MQSNPANDDFGKPINIDARKQFSMGLSFFEKGIYAMAKTWFTIAAKNHHDGAMNKLGEMFFKGLGVERNFSKAHYFWLQSALRKNNEACHHLSLMYREGFGVQKNDELANYWENKIDKIPKM